MTLLHTALNLCDYHAKKLSAKAVASHVARNAAPTVDVGSTACTPEHSEDETQDDDEAGEKSEGGEGEQSGSEQEENLSGESSSSEAGPSTSASNPLGFDGRWSDDDFQAILIINAGGRPTWRVKRNPPSPYHKQSTLLLGRV